MEYKFERNSDEIMNSMFEMNDPYYVLYSIITFARNDNIENIKHHDPIHIPNVPKCF